jgi:probable rRNA maturation factor
VTAGDPSLEVVDPGGLGCEAGPVIALVAAVLEAEHTPGSVVVAFVNEQGIADLNTRYRLPEATDVLSFRVDDEVEPWPDVETPVDLGEVVICPAVVRRYAIEEGVTEAKQLGWTIVHGVLHLLGYDHETDQGEMRAREQELLRCLAPLIDRLL